MLDEIVVRATVKPTDWLFTSQKHTRRPQVFDRGRYARRAPDSTQSMLATEAVMRRAAQDSRVSGKELKVTRLPQRVYKLTVWHIENDRSTDKEGDNLDCVANRLQLGGHGRAKPHVSDDNSRKGVYDAVRDSTVR